MYITSSIVEINMSLHIVREHSTMHTLSAAAMTAASGLDSTGSFTLSTCSKVGLPTSSAAEENQQE